MTGKQKLRGWICGQYGSISALSRHMGWGRQKLQRIVSGKQIPILADLCDLSCALNKSMMELAQIFLDKKSPNEQHHCHHNVPCFMPQSNHTDKTSARG